MKAQQFGLRSFVGSRMVARVKRRASGKRKGYRFARMV